MSRIRQENSFTFIGKSDEGNSVAWHTDSWHIPFGLKKNKNLMFF